MITDILFCLGVAQGTSGLSETIIRDGEHCVKNNICVTSYSPSPNLYMPSEFTRHVEGSVKVRCALTAPIGYCRGDWRRR